MSDAAPIRDARTAHGASPAYGPLGDGPCDVVYDPRGIPRPWRVVAVGA